MRGVYPDASGFYALCGSYIMKILQIVPELKVGGVETGTVDLARKLIKRGHEAVVVSNGGELVEELTKIGAEHIQMPVHKKNPLLIIKLSFQLKKIIREKEIDIVHARSRVPAWIAFLGVRGTNAHFITSCHGYYSRHFGSRVMGWGERVIAVSRIIEEHMSSAFHVPIARMRVIPRGIDIKKYNVQKKNVPREKDEWHIGIVGRLTQLKGHTYFIKAIKEVLKTVPNVRAFIIGEASENKRSYKEELLRLTEKLDLKDHVVFTGACSNVPAVLPSLDCLCMASTIPEAFGRVIIEAQAARVPVVATRTGGAIDIIDDNKTGVLVEPRNPHDLARGIIQILKHRTKTNRMVEAAFARVGRRFTLNKMVDSTLQVYEEVLKSPRILVVKFSSLGDAVLISPTLRALRKKYPDAFISVITYPVYREIFEHCPYIDDLIIYDRTGLHHRFRGFMRLVWELRRRRYNFAIDLQNNFRSHVMIFLSKAKMRVGYARGRRGMLLTHKIPYKKEIIDPVRSQFNVLACMGMKPKNKDLEFWFSEDDKQYVDEFLKRENVSEKEPIFCVFPGSHQRWITKRWPIDRFVSIADKMYEKYEIRTVFIGGKDNISLCNDIKDRSKQPYVDAIGKTTITQLGALISRCSLLLTGDSAPLHIGAAVGVPVIAFFGPTDPARHTPPGNVDVCYKSLDCSPCYLPECKQNSLICMESIREEEVMGKIEEILKKGVS